MLSKQQREELQAWQRRMLLVFVTIMGLLLMAALTDMLFGMPKTMAVSIFLLLIALVALSVFIQFSQKCPACGYRIGFQARLLVPDNCKQCGVKLK